MHPAQITQIKRLTASGFSDREIAGLTGRPVQEIYRYRFENMTPEEIAQRRAQNERAELSLMAVKLMQKVPAWWKGTAEAYRRCVRANFCDVLGS